MNYGVPIIAAGHIVGAVGVSGVKSEQDAQVSHAGAIAIQEQFSSNPN